MATRFLNFLTVVLVLNAPTALEAQDYDYHPTLSDRFTGSLGAMRSSNSFDISAEGVIIDRDLKDIDFNERLGVSDRSTLFNGQLRWKFGDRLQWSLWGQYFGNTAKGNAVLKEDVEWRDVIFREGTYAEAGVKLEVARLFVGRSFVKKDQHDFGFGVGIHNLDLSAYIEGEVKINDNSTGTRKVDASASQVLPNAGFWYNFSPAKRWLVHSRVDWISASIGDYDGQLWNVSAGVNFMAWRHVGIDLAWQYFNLHVDVEKNDWNGSVNMSYNGPVLSATFNW